MNPPQNDRRRDEGMGVPPQFPIGMRPLPPDLCQEIYKKEEDERIEIERMAGVSLEPDDVVEKLHKNRRQDEGMGIPPQIPISMRSLTTEDDEAIRKGKAAERLDEERMVEELLVSNAVVFRVPRIISGPLAIAFVMGVCALLFLFVFSHVTSTLASLQTLPDVYRYVGWVLLTVLTGVVVFATVRLTRAYFRLKPNQPIRLDRLEELSRRTQLRWLASKKQNEAMEKLKTYLKDFPIEEGVDRKRLQKAGLTEDELNYLITTRENLLNRNRFSNNSDWFAEFKRDFQDVINKAAKRSVEKVAKRVGVVTAASPNSIVDMAVIVHAAFTMMADVCQLYNLRMSRMGTFVMVGRVFRNTYLAGKMNEWEDIAASGIQNSINTGADLGSMALEATFAKFLGKAGAKAGVGLLNYYLFSRLGNSAIRMVQPLAE